MDGVLSEIRNLRTQLERSVASNNMLHQKLDRYVENRQADLLSISGSNHVDSAAEGELHLMYASSCIFSANTVYVQLLIWSICVKAMSY